jgi:hypothetical protein
MFLHLLAYASGYENAGLNQISTILRLTTSRRRRLLPLAGAYGWALNKTAPLATNQY